MIDLTEDEKEDDRNRYDDDYESHYEDSGAPHEYSSSFTDMSSVAPSNYSRHNSKIESRRGSVSNVLGYTMSFMGDLSTWLETEGSPVIGLEREGDDKQGEDTRMEYSMSFAQDLPLWLEGKAELSSLSSEEVQGEVEIAALPTISSDTHVLVEVSDDRQCQVEIDNDEGAEHEMEEGDGWSENRSVEVVESTILPSEPTQLTSTRSQSQGSALLHEEESVSALWLPPAAYHPPERKSALLEDTDISRISYSGLGDVVARIKFSSSIVVPDAINRPTSLDKFSSAHPLDVLSSACIASLQDRLKHPPVPLPRRKPLLNSRRRRHTRACTDLRAKTVGSTLLHQLRIEAAVHSLPPDIVLAEQEQKNWNRSGSLITRKEHLALRTSLFVNVTSARLHNEAAASRGAQYVRDGLQPSCSGLAMLGEVLGGERHRVDNVDSYDYISVYENKRVGLGPQVEAEMQLKRSRKLRAKLGIPD